jgi:hypothetical protein
MTIWTEGVRVRRVKYLEEFEAPLPDVLSATGEQALIESPSPAILRQRALEEAELGRPVYGALAYGAGPEPILREAPDSPLLSADDAKARLQEQGLASALTVPDEGIRSRALDILIERKTEERRRQDVLNRAPSGILPGAARLGVALGASLLDPLNIASAFVPVVGEARYAALLARAGGTLGRIGVRAGVGAIEGAVGQALVEPIIYRAMRAEQADYDMTDSLIAVAFGTVLGGGLHVGAGAIGDALARGAPWQTVRPADGLPRLLDQAAPETRAAALRTAVAQAVSGRQIDVEALLAIDPRYRSRADLLGTTAVERGGAIPAAPAAPQPAAAALAGPSRTLVADVPQSGNVRVFDTLAEAQKAAEQKGRRQGVALTPIEADPGRFILARESTAAPIRMPDGSPRPFLTQRAAERYAVREQVIQGKQMAAVPFQAPEGRRWTLVPAETADEQAAVRAMRAHPTATRFPAAPDRSVGASIAADTAARRAEGAAAIRDAARRNFQPEASRLADFPASRAADEALAAAPKEIDTDAATAELADVTERLNELAVRLGDPEIVARELAPFDELAEMAEAYGRAVRAAASCTLRRG